MKSMDLHHHDSDNGGLAIVMWISGIVVMIASNHQPSEVRAWIMFGLGVTASLISIIMNWSKFTCVVKKKFSRKTKTKHNGK